MISMLDHLSSCLHADSAAQPQTPPSEITGQRINSAPDYLPMHIELRYPYGMGRHFCEVLLISIHELNKAVDEAWKEVTHQLL